MSDLLWGVLKVALPFLESAALGSETARCQGLLFFGHGLAFPPAAPLATLRTGSRLSQNSRPASVGLATRVVHASGVVRDGLAMMLFAVVAVAAQGTHTTGALMIR